MLQLRRRRSLIAESASLGGRDGLHPMRLAQTQTGAHNHLDGHPGDGGSIPTAVEGAATTAVFAAGRSRRASNAGPPQLLAAPHHVGEHVVVGLSELRCEVAQLAAPCGLRSRAWRTPRRKRLAALRGGLRASHGDGDGDVDPESILWPIVSSMA